ncbi:MFS transporter [Gordonia jinhuaensis]|uniref:MFS transporter n=1 Tax=Gordonia jinhuaensis TaxID=1517702 RepID=A0A916TBZ9_9ACTN|nr:MFS transporter [Gordonia jinhuaensis]GGB38774.1 MFS transporter [Gordonia jinhuaensis]
MSITSYALDLKPVRASRSFRHVWIGQTISRFGGQMSGFALMYLVWVATRSPALVGLIGVIQGLALLVFGLVGGHVADIANRKAILVASRVGQLVASCLIAALVLTGTWHLPALFVLTAVSAALSAFAAPADQTIAPRLLDPAQLPSGLALMRVSSQIAILTGPVIAGLVISTAGIGVCFVVDSVTFLAALWGISAVPRQAAQPERRPDDPEDPDDPEYTVKGLRATVEGARFLLGDKTLRSAALVDIAATVLALPIAVFPAINAERFGGSPHTLSLMLPAIGLGGVVAGLMSGKLTGYPHQGRIMLISCLCWGGAIAAFGLSTNLAVALSFLVIAGAADTCTVIARGSLVQLSTPDRLRGRVSSIDYLIGAGGPSLGAMRAGLVADVTSGAISCITGGTACAAVAIWMGLTSPNLRHWTIPRSAGQDPAE